MPEERIFETQANVVPAIRDVVEEFALPAAG
jgi:hypothetical protein